LRFNYHFPSGGGKNRRQRTEAGVISNLISGEAARQFKKHFYDNRRCRRHFHFFWGDSKRKDLMDEQGIE
jgi:hypothetical protein